MDLKVHPIDRFDRTYLTFEEPCLDGEVLLEIVHFDYDVFAQNFTPV
jgi:hypothetical protein